MQSIAALEPDRPSSAAIASPGDFDHAGMPSLASSAPVKALDPMFAVWFKVVASATRSRLSGVVAVVEVGMLPRGLMKSVPGRVAPSCEPSRGESGRKSMMERCSEAAPPVAAALEKWQWKDPTMYNHPGHSFEALWWL